MIDFIWQFFSYTKLFITMSLLTYIYKYLFESCSEKKIIKNKKEKPKKVIKTRISLSLFYLILLVFLYFAFTWYIFITIMIGLLLIILCVVQKFDPKTLDVLKTYDSLPIIKKIWYIYSKIIFVIFKIFSPCHKIIDNNISKNMETIKTNLLGQLTKINLGNNFGLFNAFSDMSINKSGSKSIKTQNNNDLNKLELFFKNQNDKNIKSKVKSIAEQSSELNKYIIENTKENKLDKNANDSYDSISDFEEPIDVILLEKTKSNVTNDKIKEDLNDIGDFMNKINTLKNKVNSSKTVLLENDD